MKKLQSEPTTKMSIRRVRDTQKEQQKKENKRRYNADNNDNNNEGATLGE